MDTITFELPSTVSQPITFEQLPAAISQLYNKVESIERLLQRQQLPPEQVDELFTIQQASDFLKLTIPTIYGLVSRSVVPVSKKGKRLYFSKAELTAWIKEGRRKTTTELQSEAASFLKNRKRG
jgi:hypothetical protein